MQSLRPAISVILPARNEAGSIDGVIRGVASLYPEAEIIVVDDGSSDGTGAIARAAGALVITHPYGKGNGAAIKTGARAAAGETLVLMDADGQHDPRDIQCLLHRLGSDMDMVVGARGKGSQAGAGRMVGNGIYNALASLMVGHRVMDLTSGFRAVNAERFREFLYLLPNGFSYPTTITMAFFRSGYSVGYEQVVAARRAGKSHLRVFRDGIKFLLIIFRVCTLYSPLKIFFPISLAQFLLGSGYYLYTYVSFDRFTNMSALMLTSALTTLLIGLISEQITALLYKHDVQPRQTPRDDT